MKLLLCVGEGLGDAVNVLPLAKTLHHNKIRFDVLNLTSQPTETIKWLFSAYAEGVASLWDISEYSGRIELGTTFLHPQYAERKQILQVNSTETQKGYYRVGQNAIEMILAVARELKLEIPIDAFDVEMGASPQVQSYDFIIHNGCSLVNNKQWARKKYPNMKGLIKKLLSMGYTVACVGDKKEYLAGANETGHTIETTAALIKNCKCVITTDSGVYNLAAGLKAKGLVIFTASSQMHSYHQTFHRTFKIIKRNLNCQPCLLRETWDKCSPTTLNKLECQNISIESIIKEIKNYEIF